MKMKIFSVHVPAETTEDPSVKLTGNKKGYIFAAEAPNEDFLPKTEDTEDGGKLISLVKSFKTYDHFEWLQIEDELNATVVDNFLKLLSAFDSKIVKTNPLVGISWVFTPRASEDLGKVKVEFAQGIFLEENLDTFLGKELATEIELEFFEAI